MDFSDRFDIYTSTTTDQWVHKTSLFVLAQPFAGRQRGPEGCMDLALAHLSAKKKGCNIPGKERYLAIKPSPSPTNLNHQGKFSECYMHWELQ